MNKDNVAKKIANSILNVQKRFATFMNAKTKGCSVRTLGLASIVVCAVYIFLSVLAIVDVFKKKASRTHIPISHIRMRAPINEKEKSVIIVSAAAYHRMQQFRVVMDSLRICDKNYYDSILTNRPGLMDSIQLLETIYIKQQR